LTSEIIYDKLAFGLGAMKAVTENNAAGALIPLAEISEMQEITCVRAARERLPARRRNITKRIVADGISYHVTLGFYQDGRVGEIFINAQKCGMALNDWASTAATLMSMLLQFGAEPIDLVKALRGSRWDFIALVLENLPEGDVLPPARGTQLGE
jgi:hypothetical protein